MNLWQKIRRSTRNTLTLEQYAELIQLKGNQYWVTGQGHATLGATQEEIDPTFQGFVNQMFKANPIVFGCMMARQSLFAEARFKYRRKEAAGPGDLFGKQSLKPLEEPWPDASTSDLLKRMIQDVDLAGNFFGAKRPGGRIVRLRPDWVTIILGSRRKPKSGVGFGDIDVEPIGYSYQPGGKAGGAPPVALLASEVAHFAPIPDPMNAFRGMSWLTPIIRDVSGDQAGAEHKLKYLELGATPNVIVTADPKITPEAFERFQELYEEEHGGLDNAYGTLFLGGGADVEVVGSDMQKLDFRAIQALGENRICIAARVPGIVAGATIGLESATYSNLAQLKRFFADSTISPLWRDACAALQPLVETPSDAELWYDARDIPYLQEDRKDEAEIQQKQAVTITQLVKEGFTPESSTKAVIANDMSLLEHSGALSVQLHKPGESPAPEPSPNEDEAGPPVAE